jgi:hypothetical protein
MNSVSRRQYDLWDKFWRDKKGNVVIFQWPNALLIAWAVLSVLSLIVSRGHTQQLIWWVGNITLAVWALVELIWGVNYFRKALGLVVLLLSVASALNLG